MQNLFFFPQAAYQALSEEQARNYKAVKSMVLDALDISPETFQRQYGHLQR